MGDYLELKWGTLKGYCAGSQSVRAACQKFLDLGNRSLSAMMQRDTSEQKQALCDWIDAVAAVGGDIWNDWSGEKMSADEAKRYIREYGL